MGNIRSRNFSGTKCATVCFPLFSIHLHTNICTHCISHIGDFILFHFFFLLFSSLAHSLVAFSSFGAIFNSGNDFSVFVSFVCMLHLKSSVLQSFRFSIRFFLKNTIEKLQPFSTILFPGVISTFPMIH